MVLTQLVLFEFHDGAQAVGVGAAHEYLWPPLAFFDGFSESDVSDDESIRLLTMLGVGF